MLFSNKVKRYYILLQTIPAQFVTDNELFTYDHAILRRMGEERRVVLYREIHKENPTRTNHMNLRTNWRILAVQVIQDDSIQTGWNYHRSFSRSGA
jgi:hypothetical protein